MKGDWIAALLSCGMLLLAGCSAKAAPVEQQTKPQSMAAFGGDDLPRPGTVVMQYTGLGEYSEEDPPTYACVGDRDGIANWRIMQARLSAMQSIGIDTEFHVYPGLGHGFGLGTGTSAEGWLGDAVAFWEKQTGP